MADHEDDVDSVDNGREADQVDEWDLLPVHPDYPTKMADIILGHSLGRFDEKADEYGDGQGWRDDAPEDMADAGIQKLHEFREHRESGDREAAMTALADAYNYLVFAGDSMLHSGEESDETETWTPEEIEEWEEENFGVCPAFRVEHRPERQLVEREREDSRPEGWPEMYSAMGRGRCPHQMHWDSEEGVYRCINGCGEVDEEPPEGKIVRPDGGQPVDQDDAEDETPIWQRERDDDAEQAFVEQHGQVGQITVGTILEYDDWQWAMVSELATDRDEPKFGIIPLDKLPDEIHQQIEAAAGCQQHYAAVEHLTGGDNEYWVPVGAVRNFDQWDVLGPIHPEHRDSDDEQEASCDGGKVADTSVSEANQRDAGVPCNNCGSVMRRPKSNHCADCGQYAPDPAYAHSPMTDTWYRVWDYERLGDGEIQATDKEEVGREEVPQRWIEATEERTSESEGPEQDTHWKDQDECQSCGAGRDEAHLRAIKLKSGGRDLLCEGCFADALEDGRVHPDDPRLSDQPPSQMEANNGE